MGNYFKKCHGTLVKNMFQMISWNAMGILFKSIFKRSRERNYFDCRLGFPLVKSKSNFSLVTL